MIKGVTFARLKRIKGVTFARLKLKAGNIADKRCYYTKT
ncbi:hypothetical protein LTSEMIS_5023 [Salmonella enterica subsp. enterica serovar Mississippi str. A4-633]|nr:hypothetical protein LTSEMIS_5023 [Salmonella enterica subsp. enterica serovar Mississippi str. A4-633]